MSKVLQKASKKAEAKRAQSGAHKASTSEVERCLSGEVNVKLKIKSIGLNGVRRRNEFLMKSVWFYLA